MSDRRFLYLRFKAGLPDVVALEQGLKSKGRSPKVSEGTMF